MILWFLALVAVAAKQAPAPSPATIVSVTAQLPDPDHARLTLRARGEVGALASLASQHLFLGGLNIPVDGSPDVAVHPEGFDAVFGLTLARIPPEILTVDPHAAPVRFEARDPQGRPVLAAEGQLDLGDPGLFKLPLARVYELYARLDQLTWDPSLTGFGIRALVSFYNPFSFPITVRRLHYRVLADQTELLATSRPGFRLKPQQRSDTLLEQHVAFAELGAAAQALLGSQKLALHLQLVLDTPAGPRTIPVVF